VSVLHNKTSAGELFQTWEAKYEKVRRSNLTMSVGTVSRDRWADRGNRSVWETSVELGGCSGLNFKTENSQFVDDCLSDRWPVKLIEEWPGGVIWSLCVTVPYAGFTADSDTCTTVHCNSLTDCQQANTRRPVWAEGINVLVAACDKGFNVADKALIER